MDKKILFPDVIGYYLKDAVRILNQNNIKKYKIKVTSPPRHVGDTYNEDFRVLRINCFDMDNIELLVCNPVIL